MEQTIFEKIIQRQIPAHIIYEDADTIAILDIKPKSLGHTLVIPKTVSKNILEMNPATLGQYFAVVQKIAQALTDSLVLDGINIILNINEAGGQEVFHTHTHIIPRKINQTLNLNDGTHVAYSSQEQMEEYAEKIKAHLS